jgi:hypothetical protein
MARFVPAVKPELLMEANARIIADRVLFGSADIIKTITASLAQEHTPEELLAVSHRLMGLARFIGSGKGKQWTKNVSDWRLLDEALFRAAARAPLRERKMLRDIKFVPEEFLQIALQEVCPKGAA